MYTVYKNIDMSMYSIAIFATILANRSLSLHIHPLTDAQNQLNADHHTDLESQRHKRRRAWSPWDNWSENDKGILSQAVTHMKTKMHYDVGKARHGETSQPIVEDVLLWWHFMKPVQVARQQ